MPFPTDRALSDADKGNIDLYRYKKNNKQKKQKQVFLGLLRCAVLHREISTNFGIHTLQLMWGLMTTCKHERLVKLICNNFRIPTRRRKISPDNKG